MFKVTSLVAVGVAHAAGPSADLRIDASLKFTLSGESNKTVIQQKQTFWGAVQSGLVKSLDSSMSHQVTVSNPQVDGSGVTADIAVTAVPNTANATAWVHALKDYTTLKNVKGSGGKLNQAIFDAGGDIQSWVITGLAASGGKDAAATYTLTDQLFLTLAGVPADIKSNGDAAKFKAGLVDGAKAYFDTAGLVANVTNGDIEVTVDAVAASIATVTFKVKKIPGTTTAELLKIQAVLVKGKLEKLKTALSKGVHDKESAWTITQVAQEKGSTTAKGSTTSGANKFNGLLAKALISMIVFLSGAFL